MTHRRCLRTFIAAASFLVASSLLAAGEPGFETGVMAFEAAASRAVDGAPAPPAPPAKQLDARRDLHFSAGRIPQGSRHLLGALTAAERSRVEGQRGLSLRAEGRALAGVVRKLGSPLRLDGMGAAVRRGTAATVSGGFLEHSADGRYFWTASFASDGAEGIRVHLAEANLPAGARLYVYGESGEAHGPYTFERPAASFWTNTVYAPEVFVELQFPADADLAAVRLSIDAIAHIQRSLGIEAEASAGTAALPSCFTDASCESESDLPGVTNASRAIAEMLYDDAGSVFVCTGALVNTSAGNARPFFLTANHCISTVESASSLEAYWDYRTSSCGGVAPSRGSIARTLGSTLLATASRESGGSDFTLLELSEAPPPNRYYLGWTTDDYATSGGTEIFRIAHPDGATQQFSKHVISAVPDPGACQGLTQGTYIYSKNVAGATRGGSSGSPAFIPTGLRIVGQLFGRCGQNLDDACDAVKNSSVDGSFRATYPSIAQWLDAGGETACAPSSTTLCLFNGRFQVTLSAVDQRTGNSGVGQAIPENDIFGYFSLPELTHQPNNPEVFVKLLDGRPVSGKFWVFYGGLTDLQYDLVVKDTVTGSSRTYRKAAGSFCGNADTSAF